MGTPWNHDVHYHDIVIRSVPPNCGRALDVGCGQGQLSRRLAQHCRVVIAIDVDDGALARARFGTSANAVSFVKGDVMTHSFPPESFHFIAVVATLHHLTLRPALTHFRDLLQPGGVLAIIGLYRAHAVRDYALAAIALPASWVLRCLLGHAKIGAPIQDAKETLAEICSACDELLPGAIFERRLFFRYSLVAQALSACCLSLIRPRKVISSAEGSPASGSLQVMKRRWRRA